MRGKLEKALIPLALFFIICMGVFLVVLLVQDVEKSEKTTETFGELNFSLHLQGEKTETLRYYGDGEQYVFFLPSCCGTDDVTVSTKRGITLREADSSLQMKIRDGGSLGKVKTGVSYMLGCYDQNDYLYEVPVLFMQGKNAGAVFVTTKSGTLENILRDKEYKEKGSITIADADGNLAYQGALDYIKGRGNGSWYSSKKPFNIKLQNKTDLFGMGKAKKYSLLSQEQDATLLRNKISYDLAKAAKMTYSPDSEFVDLWIDGEYYGLYLLTDRIDVSKGSVRIDDLEEEMEWLNEEELSAYETVTSGNPHQKYSVIPNDPEDITGGYLFEVDQFYYKQKEAYVQTELIKSVTMKCPEYLSKAQLEYVQKYLNYLEERITEKDGTAYEECIDTESWAKMGVLQELLGNEDFMGSSQYFYKERDKDGVYAKLYAGPVWDMDNTLGNGSHACADNQLLLPQSSWFGALCEKPEFYEEVRSCYKEIFQPLAKELLDEKLAEYEKEIAAGWTMNAKRWGQTAEQSEVMQELRAHLQARKDLLDRFWSEEDEQCIVTVTEKLEGKELNRRTYAVEKGETLENLQIPQKTGYFFDNWYHHPAPGKVGKAYELDTPVTEDLNLLAGFTAINDLSAKELTERGYRLPECTDLNIYLRLLDDSEYAAVMALTKNSGKLYMLVQEAMEMLGITTDFEALKDGGYYALIDGGTLKDESAGRAVFPVTGTLRDDTQFKVFADGEKNLSLTLGEDGENLFVNGAGLNIVVFDLSGEEPVLIDSVCFDLLYNGAASRRR